MRQSALAVSVFAATAPVAGLVIAALSAFVFAAGLSAYLHTATLMNLLKPAGFSAPASMSGLRTLGQTALDAPVLLLALCLLRPWPHLLAAFAGAYGLMLLVRAAAIGQSRLRA